MRMLLGLSFKVSILTYAYLSHFHKIIRTRFPPTINLSFKKCLGI